MFLISLIFILPMTLLMSCLHIHVSLSPCLGIASFLHLPVIVSWIVMPLVHGLLGFIMTAFYCFIYNLVTKWIGGIEVKFEDTCS